MKHRWQVLPDVTPSAARTAQFEAYTTLLLQWSRWINLIAPSDRSREAIMQRHILDSMAIVPLVGGVSGPLIDVGSGAGFPGLVVAMATERHIHLVERDGRKAAFLTEAARLLKAPVTVHHCDVAGLVLEPAAIVMARACAPLIRFLPMAARMLRRDGRALLCKGASVNEELAAAGDRWRMAVTVWHAGSRHDPVVLEIGGLTAVD